MNFILDADIRSFFDTVDREWLIRFVEHRVGGPVDIAIDGRATGVRPPAAFRGWLLAIQGHPSVQLSFAAGTPLEAGVLPKPEYFGRFPIWDEALLEEYDRRRAAIVRTRGHTRV